MTGIDLTFFLSSLLLFFILFVALCESFGKRLLFAFLVSTQPAAILSQNRIGTVSYSVRC